MNRKYAVAVICLFLFIAAVDTIPDPPAINPPRSHSCVISVPHVHGPATLLEAEWYAAGSTSRNNLANCFSFLLALEDRPVGVCPLPLVHHAADSSPPFVS